MGLHGQCRCEHLPPVGQCRSSSSWCEQPACSFRLLRSQLLSHPSPLALQALLAALPPKPIPRPLTPARAQAAAAAPTVDPAAEAAAVAEAHMAEAAAAAEAHTAAVADAVAADSHYSFSTRSVGCLWNGELTCFSPQLSALLLGCPLPAHQARYSPALFWPLLLPQALPG